MPTAKQEMAPLAALAGENEQIVGQNNTTVNKHFGVKGLSYCGYSLLYCDKKAGGHVLDGCSNPAYVPTLKQFLASKYKKVSNSAAQAGDIFIYTKPGGTGTHTGWIWSPYSGSTVITLEGNSTVYKTEGQARASTSGTGAYEGIGYKKRTLNSTYTVYRPVYDGAAPEVHDNKVGASCSVSLNLCKSGHSGPMVKSIQRILYSYGYKGADGKKIAVDGDYGSNTVYAVKSLQKKLGVPVDGEVGKDTWTAMLTKLW